MNEDPPDGSVPDEPAAEVPDVVGFDAADACQMVRTAGMVPYGPDRTTPPSVGVILEQTPPPGTDATVGQAVILHTEKGNFAPG